MSTIITPKGRDSPEKSKKLSITTPRSQTNKTNLSALKNSQGDSTPNDLNGKPISIQAE